MMKTKKEILKRIKFQEKALKIKFKLRPYKYKWMDQGFLNALNWVLGSKGEK